ncbi:MAG: bifunctional hydroxymethylpyrimidine kinase/phosphomethylpyrimidine kinase [Verrucomicrobiota bacterium]
MASLSTPPETPVALTIATSDSGGGAGIQADLKTFAARGTFGTSVFCALTAQNPREVTAIAELESDFIRAQLEAVFGYFEVRAAKTGMLFSRRIIEVVAGYLAEKQPTLPLVIDPVMVATSGVVLLQEDAIEALSDELFPRATLLTPNLDETAVLLGTRPQSPKEMEAAARTLADRYGTAVLLKGGHLAEGAAIVDLLATPGGGVPLSLQHQRIDGVNTHGSGCTLAAAIAAGLALGYPLEAAVRGALGYVSKALEHPIALNGEAFLGH